MALIDCPECGHRVSDAAETCPSCGVRLASPAAPSPAAAQPDTARLQLDLELAQLDLAWERERKRYVMHTKLGQEVVPRRWAAMIVGLVTVVVGIAVWVWLSSADPVANPGAPMLGLLLGGLIVSVGLGVGLWQFLKAEAYQEAHAEYLRKKEAARSKYALQPENQT